MHAMNWLLPVNNKLGQDISFRPVTHEIKFDNMVCLKKPLKSPASFTDRRELLGGLGGQSMLDLDWPITGLGEQLANKDSKRFEMFVEKRLKLCIDYCSCRVTAVILHHSEKNCRFWNWWLVVKCRRISIRKLTLRLTPTLLSLETQTCIVIQIFRFRIRTM